MTPGADEHDGRSDVRERRGAPKAATRYRMRENS